MTLLTYYTSNIKNEFIKLKRTFAFWLTIISALIIPLLFFIIYLVKHAKLAQAPEINPWDKFMGDQVQNAIPFFVPMFIILITSLIIQVEHKSSAVKHLFSLPIPKWSVYYSKLSIVIFSIITTYIYFFIAILFFGLLLGVIHSNLGFLDFQPDYFKYLKLLGTSFVASLGIVGIQFWLSFRVKNFIVPLAIGMTFFIIGLIVSRAPESIYFPYSFSILSVTLGDNMPQTFGMDTVTIYSLSCFLITAILGFLDIRRLNVK